MHICTSSARRSCFKNRQLTWGLHGFVMSYMALSLVHDGLPSTQRNGRTTGFGSPCCPFHSHLKRKMLGDSPHASFLPLHELGLDCPQSCRPQGMSVVWSCRLHSPRLWSRKGRAGATQTPWQGLGPQSKRSLRTLESMVI